VCGDLRIEGTERERARVPIGCPTHLALALLDQGEVIGRARVVPIDCERPLDRRFCLRHASGVVQREAEAVPREARMRIQFKRAVVGLFGFAKTVLCDERAAGQRPFLGHVGVSRIAQQVADQDGDGPNDGQCRELAGSAQLNRRDDGAQSRASREGQCRRQRHPIAEADDEADNTGGGADCVEDQQRSGGSTRWRGRGPEVR